MKFKDYIKESNNWQKVVDHFKKSGWEAFYAENKKHADAIMNIMKKFDLKPKYIEKSQAVLVQDSEWDLSDKAEDKIMKVADKRGW